MFQLSGGISEYRFLKGTGTSSDSQLSKITCADPTNPNNAATKKYVDQSAEISIGSTTPLNNEVLWINPDGISSGSSGGGGSVTVDTSLSSTSTNPVQNKVVTSALNNKVSKTDYASQTNAGVAKIWVDSDNYLCINLQ